MKATILTKITDKRVKSLTIAELREIFSLITDEEASLIIQAIKSGNAGRVQASIEMPVYRIMQEKVQEL